MQSLTNRRGFLAWAALIALVATCLLLPGLGGAFIFDDTPNIVTNQSLHLRQLTLDNILYASYSFQPGHGSRALSMLSFALDYWRGGLDPRAFKTTNLVIHALTAFCLALFLRRLLTMAGWSHRRAAAGALVIALAWAIHPLQVSSVLYVVQRMQTLATLFMVLALWAYLGMRRAQIEGTRSRQHGVLVGLFWVLGFAAKEDAVLLPLYTLALELTVLRFRAAQPLLAKILSRGYLAMAAAGTLLFLLWVAPHFWTGQAYPGRDFNTLERLLSQGRALAMYLGQIVWPLPSRLPFYYDDFAVSRSLWQPATTLPALLLVAGLLAAAWHWRVRRPLFAFGVLLFFAGHALTSNVIGLELVFEHRNHLPLIGALLALADLAVAAWTRWKLPRKAGLALVALALVALGVMTAVRAREWGNAERFAHTLVAYAPRSERAWIQLAGFYAMRGKPNPNDKDLARSIEIGERGVALTKSVPLMSNQIINKSITGAVTPDDWNRLTARLLQVPMSVQNRKIAWALMSAVERGLPVDPDRTGEVLQIVSSRWTLEWYDYMLFGAFIHNKTHTPRLALPLLRKAVELAPADEPDIDKMLLQLDSAGRQDWARELRQLRDASHSR